MAEVNVLALVVPSCGATCVTFFASLECEPLQRTNLRKKIKRRMAIFPYIEGLRWTVI
jgi:hypothetical protein